MAIELGCPCVTHLPAPCSERSQIRQSLERPDSHPNSLQQRRTGSMRGVERSKFYNHRSLTEYKVVRASFTVLRPGPSCWNSGHMKMLQLSVSWWASARRLAKAYRYEIWQWRTETFRYCPICASVRLAESELDRDPAHIRLVYVCLPRGGSMATRCLWGLSIRFLETGMMM